MTLQAIKYHNGTLSILNQLLLPMETVYEEVHTAEDAWQAIRTMKVRGAPAIAIVAALSLAVELHQKTHHHMTTSSTNSTNSTNSTSSPFSSPKAAVEFITSRLNYLSTSRPTAVNLFEACERLTKLAHEIEQDLLATTTTTKTTHHHHTLTTPEAQAQSLVKSIIAAIESMLEKDISDNKAIGRFGAVDILQRSDVDGGNGGNAPIKKVRVLTHCNTGSLATAGYGTALGVIRRLFELGSIDHVFCTETRPYNQGARLTAYELVYEKIPATLIADSMVSALLAQKSISAIIVGADRVVANGDTANKIGTYQLAITAKYHGVPFYIAAPTTSIDVKTATGKDIHIEERAASELTDVNGVRIAAAGINVWNPGFDVAPAHLITAIITEQGLIPKHPSGDGTFLVREFLEQHGKL